jgi:hypothetical protein
VPDVSPPDTAPVTPPRDSDSGRRALHHAAPGGTRVLLITLDILIVNVALTRIGRDLGGSTAGLQWVIDGYTLTFVSLLLVTGDLSDRVGAKRSIGWESPRSGWPRSAAPNLAALIAARVPQGAAAVMLPASMALIRQGSPTPRAGPRPRDLGRRRRRRGRRRAAPGRRPDHAGLAPSIRDQPAGLRGDAAPADRGGTLAVPTQPIRLARADRRHPHPGRPGVRPHRKRLARVLRRRRHRCTGPVRPQPFSSPSSPSRRGCSTR